MPKKEKARVHLVGGDLGYVKKADLKLLENFAAKFFERTGATAFIVAREVNPGVEETMVKDIFINESAKP